MTKDELYRDAQTALEAGLEGEADPIVLMATIASELKSRFPSFSWVGFYRVVSPGLLKVGPYQGGHGCTTIPFGRGVCGMCASERRTQLVPDVTAVSYHIACSSATKSEIVVPVFGRDGRLIAVLDVDSELPANFDAADAAALERICEIFRKSGLGT